MARDQPVEGGGPVARAGGPTDPGGGPLRRRRLRRSVLAAVGVVGLVGAGVVVHDAACTLTFSTGWLCQRPDGSLWRDESWGCSGGEDPRCDLDCPDSVMVSEGPRRSCSWVLQRNDWPANGEPPYHTGPSPGSGDPVPT